MRDMRKLNPIRISEITDIEVKGERIPGVSRQQLKQLKAMPLPVFRRWLLEYSSEIYNLGIADCREALKAEFGFCPGRLKRMTDHIERTMAEFAKGYKT